VIPSFDAWYLSSVGVAVESARASGVQNLDLLHRCYVDVAAAHVQAAASLLEPTTSDILRMAEETTRGDLRTVCAVLGGLAARILEIGPV
jgi:hypothetical protein